MDPEPVPDAAALVRPHPGPPSVAARNLVVGTLIAFVVAANLGNLLLSVLVEERPLVFIALNAQNRSLALASGELSAWSFYVVGFLRLIAPDPLFFLIGRWYGDGAIRWMERTAPVYGDLLRKLETAFGKAKLAIVAFAPNNPVSLFAGASGMGWGPFLAANAVGTVIRLALIRAFSEAFEGPLGSLKDFLADYRWPILAVSAVVVAFTIWSDRAGGREGIGDLMHLDEDVEEAEAEVEAEAELTWHLLHDEVGGGAGGGADGTVSHGPGDVADDGPGVVADDGPGEGPDHR